jgi:hypothetical protein
VILTTAAATPANISPIDSADSLERNSRNLGSTSDIFISYTIRKNLYLKSTHLATPAIIQINTNIPEAPTISQCIFSGVISKFIFNCMLIKIAVKVLLRGIV